MYNDVIDLKVDIGIIGKLVKRYNKVVRVPLVPEHTCLINTSRSKGY